MHPHEEFNPYFQSPQRHPRYQPQEPPQHQQGVAPPTRQHRRLRFQEPPQRNQGGFPAALVIPETLLKPQRQNGQPQRQEQPSQQDQEGLASAVFPQRQQGRPQHDQEGPAPASQRQHGRRQHQEPTTSTPPMPLPIHDPHHGNHQQEQGPRTRTQPGLNVIRSRRTNPLAWLLGVFCALLWLLIIVGGLAILIIYLVFRPRSPRFDIPAASLNAVYLDMGVLLNADVTFLANFTNPNQKVKVDFSYIVFGLYYHNTLIASSYSVPFSATRRESKLQNIHLVSSEVRLSDNDIERLRKQLQQNMVTFEVRGLFRAKSKFGSIIRYPYWLHARCRFNITGPPSGVLVSRKCITKR